MSEGSGGVPSFPPLPPKTNHDRVAAQEGGMCASAEKSLVEQVLAAAEEVPQELDAQQSGKGLRLPSTVPASCATDQVQVKAVEMPQASDTQHEGKGLCLPSIGFTAEQVQVKAVEVQQVSDAQHEGKGPCLPSTGSASSDRSVKYHQVRIKDGGGVTSTLDWQLSPPEAWSDPLGRVRKALVAALPANALHRIGKLFGAKPNEAVFTPAEVRQLQHAVCTELGLDVSWALQTYDRTPYFFNLMSAMASCLQDVDAVLPSTLSQGAPTGVGVREQIPPSGVWPAKDTPLAPDCALEPYMHVRQQPRFGNSRANQGNCAP